VSGRMIKISLGTESNAAAVVAARGPFEKDLLGRQVGNRGIRLAGLEPNKPTSLRLRLQPAQNVGDVEIAVFPEARMKDDAIGRFADVDQKVCLRDVRAILECINLAGSRRHAEST